MKQRALSTIVFASLFAVGCNKQLSLGSLTGGGDDSSQSSSKSKPSNQEASGDQEAAAPEEPVAAAGTGAPTWCAGYSISKSDFSAGFVDSTLDREGWSLKTLNTMAKAACDKPDDGKRQAQLGEWAASFKKAFAARDKDFVDAMKLAMLPNDEQDKLETETCAPYKEKNAEEGGERVAERQAESWVLGCARDPADETLFWLDRPQISEIQRAALVRRCIQADPTRDEKRMHGELSFCGTDVKKLDRGKLDKELAAMKVNAYGRFSATIAFGTAKTRGQILMARYTELAKKDDSWKTLLDAHDAGYASWMKEYEANKAVFDTVRKFDEKAAKGSKKAMAGCGKELRELWFAHVTGKKLKGADEATARATDMVGYPLLVAMMRCDAATGDYLAVSAAQELFVKDAKPRRGPRYEAYDATLTALNNLRNDREKFPLDKLQPYLPGTSRDVWYKAYEATFNKLQHDKAEGQIKDVKAKGEMVHVTFRTVKWKDEEAYACKDTRRISRIDAEGNVEYEQKCKFKTVNRTSTETPVDVPKDFAKGLKSGLMVKLMLDTKNGRVGIPSGVWKDNAKKKAVGTFGVTW